MSHLTNFISIQRPVPHRWHQGQVSEKETHNDVHYIAADKNGNEKVDGNGKVDDDEKIPET